MQADFSAAYRGRFSGLLSWDDVAQVFGALASAAGDGWWVYDTRVGLPEAQVPADELAVRLSDIQEFLRRHHKADYCGFVYVDDKVQPQLVKVFDPRNASSCSLGAPVPVFTISRIQPQTLPLEDAGGHANKPKRPAAGVLRRMLQGRS